MGMNKGIQDLRDNILKALNGSPYPIEVKRLVLSEVFTQVSKASAQVIREEIEKEDKGEAEHGEDET